jgi:hypothetical protein
MLYTPSAAVVGERLILDPLEGTENLEQYIVIFYPATRD